MTTVQLGNYTERKLARMLGLTLVRLSGHDAISQSGKRIEIKGAKVGAKGCQVCLRKHDDYGHADVSKSDIIIIVCYNDLLLVTGIYAIPVQALGNLKKITITEHGKYSQYKVTANELSTLI